MDNNKGQFIKPDALKNLVSRYGYKKEIIKKIEEASQVDQIVNLDISSLSLFPLFLETNYPNIELKYLERSVVNEGLILPLFVYKYDSKMTVINGVKRFLVAKANKLKSLPCIEIKASLNDVICYMLNNMITNKDNALVLAYAYNVLINQFSMSEKEIQILTNLSHGQINNMLRLLKLSKKVKNLILENKLSYAKARLLVNLPLDVQDKVVTKLINLSVREVEEYLRNLKSGNLEANKKTNINYKLVDNKIVIYPESQDQLNKIIRILEETNL